MAMYYQGGSEIQADGLQTLYLMNPNYIGYNTDTIHHHQHQQQQQQSANMFFLNSVAGGNFPHVSLPSQAHVPEGHLVGVPLQAGFQDPNCPSSIQEISTTHHGLLSRLWSSNDQNSPGGGDAGSGGGGGNKRQSHIPSSTVVSPKSSTSGGTTADFASQLGFQRPGLVSPTQAHHQGLSLSLSPQQQQQQMNNFRSCLPLDHHEISTTNHQAGILSSSPSPKIHTNNIDHTRGLGASSSFSICNGMILGSKYLKVAQELLDEVVNVGKNIKLSSEGGAKEKHKLDNELISLAGDDVESCNQKNSVVELTTAQRQELQMKKAKLVSMLDEVDQRYRQYHHQIQMIAASFEQTAGIGSSKSYTQLALHTISKQFRCLKDAISGQIKDTSKTLGEEENIVGKIEGSKLKFVDHHLRQQRALQQLGMMQTNAWRPQRGLPERAVSVLRAWLFEHFLHPYPKDSDKIMLAKQTGLTRSQVSNWFINARVRLWKPMVEEMYLEEVKKNNQEQNGLDQENVVPNNEVVGTKSSVPQEKLPISSNIIHDSSPTEISTSTISTSPTGGGGGGGSLPAQTAAGFSFIGSSNMENIADQRNNKKPKNDMQNSSSITFLSVNTEINKAGQDHTIKSEKFNGNNNRQTRVCYPDLMTPYTMDDQFGTRFNPIPQQLGTFHQGNGHVSLTLGLPPNSDQNQRNFLPNNQTIGLGSHYNRMNNPQASHHPNISYENIDFQSGKRYAAQLLQDFVS